MRPSVRAVACRALRRRPRRQRRGSRPDASTAGSLPTRSASGTSQNCTGMGSAARFDLPEQLVADAHGDVVLLLLQPVRSRDPAAVVIHVDGPQPGHEREQVHCRQADPAAPELAWGVIRQLLVEAAEARVEAALLVQLEQELADIPGGRRHRVRVFTAHVEDLLVLGLERVRARGRRPDDPVALAGIFGEHVDVATRLVPRRLVQAVADHRQAAAFLRRRDHFEPVPLQDGDRGVGHVLLVEVGGAAVKVDDSLVGRWHGRAAGAPEVAAAPRKARTERPARVGRQGRLAMDAEDDLEEGPEEPVTQGRVGKRALNGAPNLPSRSVWLISQSRNRGRCPALIEARARLSTSAILTAAGQAVVHQPQPEHQSTVRSGVCTCIPSRLIGTGAASRKRWACGPTYFGPGTGRRHARPGTPRCRCCI